MKGKILVSVLALGASSIALANGSYMATAPAAAVTPNYFDGFVVGIDGSMQHLNGHVQDNVGYGMDEFNAPAPPPPRLGDFEESYVSNASNLNTDVGDSTLGGGIFVGYGKVFNSNFYLGGEVYARYAHNTSNENTSKDISFISTADGEIANGRLDTSIDIDSDWSYGATLKLGYLLTPKTMLYLLAGIEYSKFDVDVTHNLNGVTTQYDGTLPGYANSYSFNQKKIAFVPGIGIETMITDKLSLKAEYTYADYGEFSHGNSSSSAALDPSEGRGDTYYAYNSSEDKVDLKRGLYTLGLSYHFNGI